MRSIASSPSNPYIRLRTWWENSEADIDVRKYAGWGALLIVIGALMRTPLMALLGVLIIIFAVLLRLWWDHALRNLTYERVFSTERAFWGDDVTMELSATNAKPMPITRLDVQEEVSPITQIVDHDLNLLAHSRNLRFDSMFSLGMYEKVTHRYTLNCDRRGWQRFGPTTLKAHDPFGMSARETILEHTNGVLVYPRMVPMADFVIPARQPLGDMKPSTPLIEDPMRVAGVRPYVAGDSPRRIHWRATARTGEMQTRVFEPSASPVAAIFLDTITFSHLWDGQNSDRLELSVVLAASMARQMIDARHQVGLYANAPIPNRARSVRVSPGRRGGQLQKILEHLAMMQPVYGDKIEVMISQELHRLPWGSSVVIITSQASADFQRALIRLARSGGAKRYVWVVIGEKPDLFSEIRKRFAVYMLGEEARWDEIESIRLDRLG